MGAALSNIKVRSLALSLKSEDCPLTHSSWKGLKVSDFYDIEMTEAAKTYFIKLKSEQPSNFLNMTRFILKITQTIPVHLDVSKNGTKNDFHDFYNIFEFLAFFFSISCDVPPSSVLLPPFLNHNEIKDFFVFLVSIINFNEPYENFFSSSFIEFRLMVFKVLLFFVFSESFVSNFIENYLLIAKDCISPDKFLHLIVPAVNQCIKYTSNHLKFSQYFLCFSLPFIFTFKEWKESLSRVSTANNFNSEINSTNSLINNTNTNDNNNNSGSKCPNSESNEISSSIQAPCSFCLSDKMLNHCFSSLFDVSNVLPISDQLVTLFYFTIIERSGFIEYLATENLTNQYISSLLNLFVLKTKIINGDKRTKQYYFFHIVILLIFSKITNNIHVLIQMNEKCKENNISNDPKSYLDYLIEVITEPILTDFKRNNLNMSPFISSILMNISSYAANLSNSSISRIFILLNQQYSKKYYKKENCLGIGDRLLICVLQMMTFQYSKFFIFSYAYKMKDLFEKLSISSVDNWNKTASKVKKILIDVENEILNQNTKDFQMKIANVILTVIGKRDPKKLETIDLTNEDKKVWFDWFNIIFWNLFPQDTEFAKNNIVPFHTKFSAASCVINSTKNEPIDDTFFSDEPEPNAITEEGNNLFFTKSENEELDDFFNDDG